MSGMVLLTVFVIPYVWSAIVAGLRQALRQKPETPDDDVEKLQLLILLAPVVLGLVMLAILRFIPVHVPQIAMSLPVISHNATPVDSPVVGSFPKQTIDIWLWLVMVFWSVYVTGMVIKTIPLVLALTRLSRVASLATPAEIAGETVRITEAAVPPLAWGHSTVILPESLIAQFSEADLLMIIHHERAHLHRGDTVWFALLSWIDALLWFNPFVRRQTALCRMAAEIACDAAVTRAAPALRGTYARVLIRTLKHTAGDVRQYAPTVFSNVKSGDYRMRINQIMHAGPMISKPGRRALYALLVVAAVPVIFAQFAWSQGVQVKPASEGLSIYAPSDGTVSRVFVDANGWLYGPDPKGPVHPLRINIDHGDGVTGSYTPTDGKTDLKVGDVITAGQLIAQSGGDDQAIITGMECLKAKTCILLGDSGHSFNNGDTVMFGHVEFRRNGRILRADSFSHDPKTGTGLAQGHIKITPDDGQTEKMLERVPEHGR